MRFLITQRLPPVAKELLVRQGEVTEFSLDRPISPEELVEAGRHCQGILAMLNDRFDSAMLDKLSELRAISNYAVGYNNIDIKQCSHRGIGVSNTPDVLTDASAELAWALLMATARRLGEAEQCVRQGKWAGWGPMQFLGRQITGKNLGIVGGGRIGQRLARMATGFDMKVAYVGRQAKQELERLGGVRMELKALLAWADFVSLHVPLTEATHHMIGHGELALMKPTAVVINTARGSVVDEAALVDALERKTIFGAGLDVYEFEPRIADRLLQLPNTVLLPHIGSATVETRTRMAELAAENLIAMVQGRRPRCPVNTELWEPG
ncbi:MAG: D-glycerate dehydrogenase [Phycisphaerales bacterium]|nr:D-glycerate dehydrogenase [Phycisphaerales bacterium]